MLCLSSMFFNTDFSAYGDPNYLLFWLFYSLCKSTLDLFWILFNFSINPPCRFYYPCFAFKNISLLFLTLRFRSVGHFRFFYLPLYLSSTQVLQLSTLDTASVSILAFTIPKTFALKAELFLPLDLALSCAEVKLKFGKSVF